MTDTHPHFLFVYGTLKSGHGNNPLLVRHESIFDGPAVTVEKFLLNDGFPFVYTAITDEVAKHKPEGYKTAINQFLGRIRGELYRVTDAGLRACDMLEGHPTSYCRTPIEVEYFIDGPGEERTTAGIYLMGPRMLDWENLQEPDRDGYLEWGRSRPEAARDFQRASGKRFSKKGK